MKIDERGDNSANGADESGYLETYWRDFHEHALGLDATPEQQVAARRAFHAGALSLLKIINDFDIVVLSNDDGATIAVGSLVDCVTTETLIGRLEPLENALGNYDPGRYRWVIREITGLVEPLPYRGKQSLFDGADEYLEALL